MHRRRPSSFDAAPKRKWWRLFRKRHPEVAIRTPETLTTSRHNISETVIRQWFAEANTYFSEEELLEALHDPSHNFNIDESGFSLSPKHGKVLAIKGEKNVFEVSGPNYKANISVLATVSADGRVPPPMIIYPRKRISYQMAEQFPEDLLCAVGKSEKGYINFENLYEYLCNTFNDWLTENDVQRPVIVWTDWHETRNNFYLASSLKSMNIILYGLPPNTTHIMQPLDVAVFGPLKKNWTKGAKEFERKNPDDMITQVNFAKVFLPIYYDSVSAANIKSGFSKCGLVPFDADKPDYSKLRSAAAVHEEPSTLFEAIDLGGFTEQSCQTDFHMTTHRGAQTSGRMFETACISYLIQCGYSILPPESTTSQMEKLKGPKKSWDDLVLDQHPAREFIASRSIPSPNPSVSRSSSRGSSRTNTPLPFLSSPPSTSYATPEPQVTPVLQRAPTKTTPSTLSSAFKTFNFYPERRQGQGPKRPRNEMDRTFAITSDKAIRALKMQMEERKAKIQKKGIRGRRTGRIKKVPPKPASSSDSENSDVPLPLSVDSSDDDIDLEQDPHSLCIKVPMTEPEVDSWVGVKVEKVATSTKGRKHKPFEIYIGRVKDVQEQGLAVTFLKEVSPGFYVYPDIEDISFPVHRREVVELQEPQAATIQRKYGFKFNSSIKSAIVSVLNR
ncbi:uncharacterized protein LOC135209721 [Macrobrachium nipponense]|uniref:uncharacterized protein LOC135209721 n=1 Tax=Macrobrachium nipponense TaxID=159736 RepID=UPI0030C8C0F1